MASRRLMRPGRLALIATFSSAASYYALTADAKTSPVDTTLVTTHGLLRSSRAVYTFAVNSLDYKYSLRGYDNKSEEYYKVRSKVHSRAARRILKLCEANKGFYVKAGQFVASLQHMPKEYVSTLSTLQDQASPCAFEMVERVLKEEFGETIMDIYQVFDKQPVAAASIAQVHHACLNDGREVAVKIQYPGLQQQFKMDIATMDILSKAVAWLFPDYQFQWLVPEFEKTSLQELDFVQEARNAEQTARLFKRNRNVKIPCIYWEWSSHRVLTMEFVHGCKIDDIESLKKAGIDPRKVARVLVEIFAQMIFLHGCVHGDPHPGNILVRQTRAKQFQLVLLDHGLYRDLEEGFRLDFCRLWKAVVLGDPSEAQKVGEQLGAGKYFKFLPIIFMGRTLESTSGLGEGLSLEEKQQLRNDVQLLTFGDVSQFMEGLPRDLLIVLRTDGLIRSIVSKLGAAPRMRLLINARHAISGFPLGKYSQDGSDKPGTSMAQLEYVNLCLRLEILEVQYKIKDFYGALLQALRSLSKYLPNWLKNYLRGPSMIM